MSDSPFLQESTPFLNDVESSTTNSPFLSSISDTTSPPSSGPPSFWSTTTGLCILFGLIVGLTGLGLAIASLVIANNAVTTSQLNNAVSMSSQNHLAVPVIKTPPISLSPITPAVDPSLFSQLQASVAQLLTLTQQQQTTLTTLGSSNTQLTNQVNAQGVSISTLTTGDTTLTQQVQDLKSTLTQVNTELGTLRSSDQSVGQQLKLISESINQLINTDQTIQDLMNQKFNTPIVPEPPLIPDPSIFPPPVNSNDGSTGLSSPSSPSMSGSPLESDPSNGGLTSTEPYGSDGTLGNSGSVGVDPSPPQTSSNTPDSTSTGTGNGTNSTNSTPSIIVSPENAADNSVAATSQRPWFNTINPVEQLFFLIGVICAGFFLFILLVVLIRGNRKNKQRKELYPMEGSQPPSSGTKGWFPNKFNWSRFFGTVEEDPDSTSLPRSTSNDFVILDANMLDSNVNFPIPDTMSASEDEEQTRKKKKTKNSHTSISESSSQTSLQVNDNSETNRPTSVFDLSDINHMENGPPSPHIPSSDKLFKSDKRQEKENKEKKQDEITATTPPECILHDGELVPNEEYSVFVKENNRYDNSISSSSNVQSTTPSSPRPLFNIPLPTQNTHSSTSRTSLTYTEPFSVPSSNPLGTSSTSDSYFVDDGLHIE